MEMQQVRYFVTLAQSLNFTRAAQQCNVSQPALTRAVKTLEEEYGGALLHRARGNTHLTKLGRIVLPHLQQIYEQAQSAKERARSAAKMTDVTLRIGVMCTIGPDRFAGFMRQFREHHPGVQIRLVDGSGREMAEALAQGEVELALFATPEGLDDTFHALELFREDYVICLAKSHPLADEPVIRWRQLNDAPCCVRAECELHDYAGEILSKMGINAKVVFESEREDWVLEMVRAGLGFAYFPAHRVNDPEIRCIPVIEPEFSRTVNLVSVRGRPHSAPVGAFVREARSYPWLGASHGTLSLRQ